MLKCFSNATLKNQQNTSISTPIDTNIDRVASLHVLHSYPMRVGRSSSCLSPLPWDCSFYSVMAHKCSRHIKLFLILVRCQRPDAESSVQTPLLAPAPRTLILSLSFLTLTLWRIAHNLYLWHSRSIRLFRSPSEWRTSSSVLLISKKVPLSRRHTFERERRNPSLKNLTTDPPRFSE